MTLRTVYRLMGRAWKIRMPLGSFPATFEDVQLVVD